MSTTTISVLERELSLSLPEQYKSALVQYPFPAGSVGEELLVADAGWLIEKNRPDRSTIPAGQKQPIPNLSQGLLLIGTNGSELRYYLRLSGGANAVMEYSLETRRLSEFAATFDLYLDRIRQIDSKIALEEAAGDERARAIPEWRHRVRFYAPAAIALLFVFVLLPLLAFGIRSLYRWMVE